MCLKVIYHLQITPSNSAMLGYKATKFQGGRIFTNKVMGCQVHVIGKAIRPLFADQVTFKFT